MVAKGTIDEAVEDYLLENKDLIDRVVDGKGSKQDIKTILNGSFSWGTSDQIEEVWITESEIDALSLISYGVPAVRSLRSVRRQYLKIISKRLRMRLRWRKS